jgi:hypothetical protein
VRLFRRREPEQEEGESPPRDEAANDEAWEDVLEEAVEEMNAALQRAGAPFTCNLEEDEHGFCLSVLRKGSGGEAEYAIEEEVLAPGDLPRWLLRLRLRLGLLVDETA